MFSTNCAVKVPRINANADLVGLHNGQYARYSLGRFSDWHNYFAINQFV